jgi:hypothetical protein
MKAPTVDRRGSIAEGLEVVPFGDPQANHSLPSHENYPEVAGPGSEGLEVVEKEEAESLHPQRKPWWKRPIILGVIAGVIVAIALGIGLGVGLGVKSKKS